MMPIHDASAENSPAPYKLIVSGCYKTGQPAKGTSFTRRLSHNCYRLGHLNNNDNNNDNNLNYQSKCVGRSQCNVRSWTNISNHKCVTMVRVLSIQFCFIKSTVQWQYS